MIYGKVIQKIFRKIVFYIQPYSARIRENTLQKRPVFTVVLSSCFFHEVENAAGFKKVVIICENNYSC